ncbi:YihY/virulence factor BrkB family protein [Tropicibacter naphthalenivorans]|uniref:YihY family inner membrane protein n=1 Tax=Tropicibacter naphthalenivorans TaxID=441103 RepID=A0A0P1G1F3_9RHOB|nr:YihY/virulence factor BrkB family protein [Tropicibacter naphthalenivorans]CUH75635.1 ribonuclease BN/unknown domain fusion protein [Tropicibacter naphthalenivorans]SMC43093.1 membrane protein [Tropicibacter naphthalenivorans]
MTRGRTARRPSHIPLKGWFDLGARVFRNIGDHNIGLLAAGVAFYGLLSLFPAITAAVAFAGMTLSTEALVETSIALSNVMPDQAKDIVMGQVQDVVGTRNGGLGLAALFSLGLAIYSASRATSNFVIGLNVVNGEKERRGFIKLTALTYGLTLALILGFLLCVVLVAALPAAVAWFGSPRLTQVVLLLRWPLMFGVGAFGLAMLYRYGPSRRRAKWRWITPGALMACALWVAGSFGFSLYVQMFGNYNATFGALGGVIVLLTWLWLSAFIVLLGATVDAELEAQTKIDTTTGPDRPMGARGAVKADTLGALRGEETDEDKEPDSVFAR